MSQLEEYLTIEEVADKLKVAKATIYRMVKRGELPAIRIGRVLRFNSRQLSELFNNQTK